MKNNSNKCDDRIMNEQSLTANIQPSEDARRVSSRPSRKLGVISKLVIGLCISLVILLFPLLAFNKVGESDNEVTAFADVVEIPEGTYFYYVEFSGVFVPLESNTVVNNAFAPISGFLVSRSNNLGNAVLNIPLDFTASTIEYNTNNNVIVSANISVRCLLTSTDVVSIINGLGDSFFPLTINLNKSSPFTVNSSLTVNGLINSNNRFTYNYTWGSSSLSLKFTRYLVPYSSGYSDTDLQNAFNDGYDLGFSDGYTDGAQSSWNDAYNVGYEEGYQGGYDRGYNVGINSIDFDGNFVDWIITGVGGFFSFEIFPNFSIGSLLGIIISVSVAIWILKLFAGG